VKLVSLIHFVTIYASVAQYIFN